VAQQGNYVLASDVVKVPSNEEQHHHQQQQQQQNVNTMIEHAQEDTNMDNAFATTGTTATINTSEGAAGAAAVTGQQEDSEINQQPPPATIVGNVATNALVDSNTNNSYTTVDDTGNVDPFNIDEAVEI